MGRVFKQILYGLLHLLVVLFIAAGIYYAFLRPPQTCFDNIKNQDEVGIDCGGVCIPCEIKDLELNFGEVQFFAPNTRQITLLARVENPSASYGAEFRYQFNVSHKFGGEAYIVKGSSFIDALNERYIVVAGTDIDPRDVQNVAFEIVELKWDLEGTHRDYQIGIENVSTVIGDEGIEVTGVLMNNSSLSVSRVRLTSLLLNSDEVIVGASSSELKNVKALSKNAFTIFFPKSEGVDVGQTKVFWETAE